MDNYEVNIVTLINQLAERALKAGDVNTVANKAADIINNPDTFVENIKKADDSTLMAVSASLVVHLYSESAKSKNQLETLMTAVEEVVGSVMPKAPEPEKKHYEDNVIPFTRPTK